MLVSIVYYYRQVRCVCCWSLRIRGLPLSCSWWVVILSVRFSQYIKESSTSSRSMNVKYPQSFNNWISNAVDTQYNTTSNSDNPLWFVMNSQMDFDTGLTTYQSTSDRSGNCYDVKVWWHHVPLTLHLTYDFWHVNVHNNASVNKHLNCKHLKVDSFPCVSDFVEIVYTKSLFTSS